MTDSVSQVRFEGRNTIAVLVLVVLGLLLLIVSVYLEAGFWGQLSSQLSTVLLVGGLWTGIYEWFMRADFVKMNREHAEEIIDQIKLAKGEESVGLIEILEDSNDFDYTPLLLESETLTILLNDGRTWISTHSDDLRQRFKDDGKRTTFIFLHPDSRMLEVMATKVDSTVVNLRGKIAESIKMLKELSSENTKLEVLGHRLFNPQSVFLGGTEAVVTLYFAARGRRTVPLLKFVDVGPHAYVRKLREDLHDLQNDSKDILNYTFAPEEKNAQQTAPADA